MNPFYDTIRVVTHNIEGKPAMSSPTFGWELILDLYDCDPHKIRTKEIILQFVIDLCDLIKMQRYGEPWAERFGLEKPQTAGYTVVQLIETSSIVAHFSELKNAVYFEIFSCAPFDPEQVKTFAAEYFGAGRWVDHFITRE